MQKLTRTLVAVLLALACANSTLAQTADGKYTIKAGDTGWELARQYYDDATTWQRIVDMNPFLQQPGRVTEKNGRIILWLQLGDKLEGLERLKVDPPKAVPIADLIGPAPKPAESPDGLLDWLMKPLPFAFLMMLLAVLSIISYNLWQRRVGRIEKAAHDAEEEARLAAERAAHELEIRRDPVTAGTPYVPGGIAPTETAKIRDYFHEQAITNYLERHPGLDRATVRVEQLGEIEDGTIAGHGEVGFLGGQWREHLIENPIDAYQGRFRFPDKTEMLLQCLMRCMNPVRFGGEVMRGFTFTPRSAVVPAPEPERPAPVPAPHPAMAVRQIVAAAQTVGENTITIGTETMVFPQGYHVTIDKATGETRISATEFKMTVQPKRQRRTATKPAANTSKTGTV